MRPEVSLHPGARQDLLDAAEWYAKRSTSAAGRFLDEFDQLLERIVASPAQFGTFHGEFRRSLFQRFPYYMIFRAGERGVMILAVAHSRRRPQYWVERISG